MVQIAELNNEWLEFEGKVLSVELIYSEFYDIERYHILIEPLNKEWKTQQSWIPISRYSTEDKPLKGTALAEIITRLDRMGIRGDTTTIALKRMVGKDFIFRKEKIGQLKKETWCPETLITPKKTTKKFVRNPLKKQLNFIKQWGTVVYTPFLIKRWFY